MLVLEINFSALTDVSHLQVLPIMQAIGDAYSNSGKTIILYFLEDFSLGKISATTFWLLPTPQHIPSIVLHKKLKNLCNMTY